MRRGWVSAAVGGNGARLDRSLLRAMRCWQLRVSRQHEAPILWISSRKHSSVSRDGARFSLLAIRY